jgi:hypothetical protein|tara:strand:- start:521 stop:1120 length:600 start_codon:yes stop_codon:yes gene_type:complete
VTGFEVYKMYLALKQHFTKSDYDYFKYRGKVRANENSFEQRRDRYFFKKLATRHSDKKLLEYFVANFASDPKGYLRSFSEDIYTDWRIYQESFTYKFKEEINLLLEDLGTPYEQTFETIFITKRGEHPHLIKRYFAGEVSLETLAVLEHCLGYVDDLDKKLTDPMWKETKMRIKKYEPFLSIDCKKYKSVILDAIRLKL